MIVHHFFYAFLNGKAVDSPSSPLIVRDQGIANPIGNLIAYLAKTAFAGALGSVFVQVLWVRLRRGGDTIKNIDASMSLKESFVSPSSIPAWFFAHDLFLLAGLSMATALITVLSTGSLKVDPNFSQLESCAVQNVDLDKATTDIWENGQYYYTRILLMGTYYPPINPCAGIVNGTSCRYSLDFFAPGLQCTNITDSYDFTPFLAPISNQPSSDYYIYNGTNNIQVGVSSAIQVATRDPTRNNLLEAVQCIPFNASYSVDVMHTNVSSNVQITSTNLLNPYNFSDNSVAPQVGYIGLHVLEGLVVGSPRGTDGGASILQNSPLGSTTPAGTWEWAGSMLTLLPNLVQNYSVSLLSSPLFAISKNSVLTSIDTSCAYTSNSYVYTPARLFAIYGAAILVTSIAGVFGFRAVSSNGVEESTKFSRLLGAILNDGLFQARETGSMTMQTKLKADDTVMGEIAPQ